MSALVEMVLRLLLAAALGAIIGFQREKARKAAGLRTHILISLGACIFTLASIYGFGPGSDPARIAAGVVAGIGVLGAGAIIRSNGEAVHGLTTAASIWAVAAIGLASGAGLYIAAVVAAILVLGVLLLPRPIR